MPPPLPPASALLFLRMLWHCQWTPFGVPAYIIMCVYKQLFLEFYNCRVYGFDFLLLRLSFLFRACSLSVDTAWWTFLYYCLVLRSYITVLYYVCLQQFCPLKFYKMQCMILPAVMYIFGCEFIFSDGVFDRPYIAVLVDWSSCDCPLPTNC